MKLVRIPNGQFMMGSPVSEKDRESNEGPRRQVTISRSFFLGSREVTQSEFDEIMGPHPFVYSSRGKKAAVVQQLNMGGLLASLKSPFDSMQASFSAHGGPALPARVESADDSAVRINVFVRGADGRLWERYWDGTAWQQSWDGTQLGQDGQTPLGPPLAIAITMTIAPSGKGAEADDQNNWKSYRHVVSILTANGIGSNSAVTTNSSTGGTSP